MIYKGEWRNMNRNQFFTFKSPHSINKSSLAVVRWFTLPRLLLFTIWWASVSSIVFEILRLPNLTLCSTITTLPFLKREKICITIFDKGCVFHTRTDSVLCIGPIRLVWSEVNRTGDHIVGLLFYDHENYRKRWRIIRGFTNIFQHDDTPLRYAIQFREFSNEQFPARWIGRRVAIEWPAKSSDLNPLDIFSVVIWNQLFTLLNQKITENCNKVLSPIADQ